MQTPARHTFRVAAATVGLAAALVVVMSGAGSAGAATDRTFAVSADSYISANSPTVTHGSLTHMKLDMKYEGVPRYGLVRFDVSGLSGTVLRATLRVHALTANDIGFTAHHVANNSWSEANVAWANAPAINPAVLARVGPHGANTWHSLDVKSIVNGNGTYSFALTTASFADALLASRENGAATAPQLVVQTDEGTPPPPPPPPTPAPDAAAPAMPSSLTQSGGNETSVGLSWSASADNVGVTGYGVYADGALVGSTTTQRAYTVNGLRCKKYVFAVDAVDAAGNRSPKKTLEASPSRCTPPPDTTPPSTPGALTKTGSTETQVSMSWTASTDNVGVAGYGVYRDGVLVDTTSASQRTYAANGLACGRSYVFTVDAYDAAGNRSAKASLTASTSACPPPPPPPPPPADTTAPSVPAALTKTGSTATQVSLSWTASTDNVGVAGYGIYRNGALIGTTSGLTSYTATGLACGTGYAFAVDAVDAAGNRSAKASLTASTSACPPPPLPPADTTAPSVPGGLTKTASTESQVSLSWTASTDNVAVAGYGVYRNGTLIGTTSGLTSYTATGLQCGTSYGFAVDAVDAAGNRSAKASLTASTSACPPPPPPPPPPGSGSNLSFPVRAAFYYPWFPETWTVGGQHVKYHPGPGYYDSSNAAVAQQHVRALDYGRFQAAIASWWGPNTHAETTRLPLLLNTTSSLGSSLKWSVYHEMEGSANPSVASLQSDLAYLASNYASHPAYARIGGKPVIFVYNANDSSCEVATRWKQAAAGNWFVVLKVFPGYATCANQPDSWHQYGPATAANVHLPHSYNISPGFWLANEVAPRLARDPVRWSQNVRDMIASGANWQLVTSFNEWGEGTAVENATEWASASGYGTYLDALNANGGATVPLPPPPAGDTTPPSTPTGLAASGATQTSITVGWNASTDNVGVAGYGVYRNGTLLGTTANRSFTVAGTCGTSYTVAVDAYDAAGNRSARASLTVSTSPCTTPPPSDTLAPSAPSSLRATASTGTSVTVAWNASTDNVGVTGYNVFRNGTFVASTSLLAHTFGGLTCGTSYTFAAEALDAAGNRSTRSTLTAATSACPPPPSGSDPVIAIAGDIAGDGAGDTATAALLDSLNPTAVLTAGDNAYNDGTLSQFNQYYEPTWGRHKAKTFPTPGNHEYHTGGTGYYQYFGARAGPSGKGYYSYNIGSWHLIALNSEISVSEQTTWLRTDLANNAGARCVLAYWHKPRWTAGNYGDHGAYAPWWTELYNANADVVVGGHDHNYQRYKPLNPSGAVDTARGIREFVVGTGGRSHYGVRADSRRDAADGSTYGILKLTLHASSYTWQFIPEGGRTYTDSGTGTCH